MTKRYLSILLFTFFAIILSHVVTSCYYDNEEDLYPAGSSGTNCDTTSYTFSAFVSPLIVNSCGTSGCHNATTQSAGVNLSNYTTIKSYITSSKTVFFGTIKHQSGYSQMPKGSAKFSDCNIKKLELWVNKGMPNN